MIKDSSVTVMVSDLVRAIKFYTETLGLKLIANYGGHYAEIIGPGIKIGLHPMEKDYSSVRCENLSIGFAVDDLDSAVSELKNKGIVFTRIVDDGPVRLAHFADPDENPLYLAQQRKW